jgi:PAS domain S-box-containing protein
MQIPSGILSGLFEAIGVGIQITDVDGKILAVNEHYCAIYGYSREELVGQIITYLLSPSQGDEALRLYKQQFQLGTRETNRTNWTVINKKGETEIVNVSAFNVLDEDGKKYRVSIIKELRHAIRSESENEFHASILENVQDSLVVADIHGKIIYWNHAAGAIYGKNEEEVIGQELHPYLPAGEPDGIISHFRQGNKILDFNEWRYCSPEGEEKYLNLRITPLLDSLEMLIGLIVIVKDVSEQYRDKQQIREQRNLLASLLESQSNFLIRLNVEGRYSYSNKAYISHGDYQENILGQYFLLYVNPKDRESWEAHFQLLKSSGKLQKFELRMLRKDGEIFWVSWEFAVLQGENGQVLAIQGVGVDISERKKIEQHRDYMLSQYQAINEELQASEEELRQNLEKTVELNKYIQHSEQRFRSLLENSFEAIILYDEPGYITYVSPTVEDVLGYSMEEMLGAKGMHFIHPEDKDNTRALLARMMEKPGNKVYILQRVRRKDGAYIWTEAYATNLLHDEHVKGVVSNFRDVTDRKEQEEKLRSSEAFLNAAQHIAKIGSAEFDLSTGQVRNSSGVYIIYDYDLDKYPEEEFRGYDYLHPEDIDKTHKLFRSTKDFGPEWVQDISSLPDEVLEEVESMSFEYRIISASGKLKYLRSNSRVMRDERGKPQKIILTIQDISEEKYRERLLDDTSHIARIGGWELDVEKNRIFWTEQTYCLFEISPDEELSIERATEYYHPDYRPLLSRAFQLLMSQGIPFDLELKMITESRKARWVRLIGQAEMVHNKIVLAKGTMQDVTDKKNKEQEIRDYAERLRLATEAAGIGIWDWDFLRNTMVWDQQMLDMYGIRKEADKDGVELSDEEWKAALHPDDPIARESYLQESLEKEYSEEEFRILRPSGEIRWIKAYAKILHNEQGQPLRAIGVNWDITKLKQIEGFLRKNNLELAKTNEELDHFVYSTSHNLRAPLTSIMGIISLIKHYRNPEEYLVYMELIEKSVQKLDETIMEITNYSRNTRVEVAREPVDFEALIKSVLESLSFVKEAGNIDITYKIPANLKFCSDTSRLKMILTNLMSNAIKYADPGEAKPFIMVLIRKEGKGIQISVKDNGIGIAPEYQEKIFNMFFRATTHSHGSGLGLYIVKEAVDKLGGSIRVESSTGKGTTFTVKLSDLSA